MSWKHWKRGALIAVITGISTGAIGLASGITWQQAWIIFGVCVGKDMLLYLKEHPLESIHDTEHTRRCAARAPSRHHTQTDLHRSGAAPESPPGPH